METATLLGFAIVSMVGIATPGPDVLLAIRNGSKHGVVHALAGIAGVAVSDLLIISAVALGLGAVLAASELFYLAVKLVGAGYLSYVGFALLFAHHAPITDQGKLGFGRLDQARELFFRGFLVAFTNVKVWLFFAAFLPQFVRSGDAQISQYVILATVFEMMSVLILSFYAYLGATATRLFEQDTAKWIDRIGGIFLVSLAATVVFHQTSP